MLHKNAVIEGYLVTVKPTKTVGGKEMNFGTWLDADGQYFDSISYPPSGGEFGWGGTPAISQRRCPKGSSDGTEIPPRTKGYKLPSLTRAFSELLPRKRGLS